MLVSQALPHHMKIEIHFSDSNSPELMKVLSVTAGGETLRSVRGLLSFEPHACTFTWSGAVHALSILFVRAAEFSASAAASTESAHLEGGKDSPAASLDYALSKQPRWLREMFGETRSGEALFYKLVAVVNRNGKRTGPVSLRFRYPESVSVYLGANRMISAAELRNLGNALEGSWKPHGLRRVRTGREISEQINGLSSVPAPKLPEEVLRALFRNEANRTLRSIDVFHSGKTSARIKSMLSDPSFRRVAGDCSSFFGGYEALLPSAERCGVVDPIVLRKALSSGREIRVAVAMSSIGAQCLFTHLKRQYGLPFQTDYCFSHALEIANRILANDPVLTHDLCAVASAPAASLLANWRKHEYEPVMFLPAVTQRIVAPKSKNGATLRSKWTALSLLYENPSIASFYMDHLVSSGTIQKRNLSLTHQEPWEAASDLSHGDPSLRSILFFPYAELNVEYNNCEFVDLENGHKTVANLILFAHRSLICDKHCLRAVLSAIRSAWRDLLSDKQSLHTAVDYTIASGGYTANLFRVSGLPVLQ